MNAIIKQINEDIFLLSDNSSKQYFNSTVIFTNIGPIIVDVFRDKKSFDDIREFIVSKGWDKPAAIIYTHWHIDHTCGNQFYKNTRIISHEATYRHLKTFIKKDLKRLKEKNILDNDIEPLLPTETFYKDITLCFGDKKIRLIHSPGHTYDSIIVYDIDSKVLIAGDSVIGKEVEFFMPPVIPPDEQDANHRDLEKTFELIEALNPQTIIPGHGGLQKSTKLLELNIVRYKKCLERNLKFTK